jgi:hypothetical protein
MVRTLKEAVVVCLEVTIENFVRRDERSLVSYSRNEPEISYNPKLEFRPV